MPPKIETDKERVLDAVMAMIDESGWSAVSARTVAKRLGVSTQPIYRIFGDMDGLRQAATARGFEMFSEYVKGEAIDQAVRYVTFAVSRGKLFNFLFRSGSCEYGGLDDMAHKLVESTDIIDRLQRHTGLPRERVYRLHLCLWMALHGLAAIAADNRTEFTEDEVKALVMEMTGALSAYYKA